ncbi:hypothetical protein DFO73_11635 [Cytobacillus oceanisediminis]|uniref:Uncharacterized protein n=1 Tax=Cytobacillus oceanisediminis TaxID=665099 RepID=A0A2V2ZTF3_9BACI|nr:hypothetical protein [Cytobacillus oceanisediminis]PWW20221.1 hypothetical protein DFO73_11635 [Cytobacillus oceanisediminis]
MKALKSISNKIFEEMDLIKNDFFREVVSVIGSNNTISYYCKLYEALFYDYLKTYETFINNDAKIIHVIAEIIKWVWEGEIVEDKDFSNIDFNVLHNYFQKVYEVHQSNTAFLSEYFNLFTANIINDEKVSFTYINKEVDFYEKVNHLLITDFQEHKGRKIIEKKEKAKKNGRYLNAQFHAKNLVECDFELPDDYRILDFTIGQVKEFWKHLYTDAWNKKSLNVLEFKKFVNKNQEISYDKVNNFKLMEVNPEKWNLRSLTLDKAKDMLEILSFNGQKKFNRIHSSLISEPIIKMPDSRYIIIPSAIFSHEPERYSLQVFDKHISYYQNIGQEVPTDDDRREVIFVEKLYKLFRDFKYKKDSVNIPDSDIDYIVFDEITKTLICFELKWITEPFTPSEIKTKEKPLVKGLEIQLPKYKNAAEGNTLKTLKSAFGNNFDETPVNFYYFVLTNLTIGSGFLNRSTYKIVNIRMLEKALSECENNLKVLSEILFEERYIKNAGDFIETTVTTKKCLGIEISQPEFSYKGGFSLES